MKTTPIACLLATTLTIASCSQEAPKSSPSAQTATNQSVETASLPDEFFLSQQPTDAIPLHEARANAKPGDTIAFTGYIGGRAEPFTEGRALFVMTDMEKAPACGDECSIPWDACCVPKNEIGANSASVQVVDPDGQILRVNLKGENGLVPGAKVTVSGKVRESNDAVFIVDASNVAVLAN